jgi:hypothetical protein
MEKMWLILTEIIGDSKDSSSDSKIGFMNITTWAESGEIAGEKIRRYIESFGWHLVSVEKADVIDEKSQYGDDIADMIDKTRTNPNAIILGTFHTYKTN